MQSFLQQHALVRGVTLQSAGSTVLDGVDGLLSVSPPAHITQRSPGKRTMRRPNDRKTLTVAGQVALSRKCAPGPGQAGKSWAGSVVWKLKFRCPKTPLCDDGCSASAVCLATTEQISRGEVLVRISGAHSESKRWDPSLLPALGARDQTKRAQLSASLEKSETLKLERAVAMATSAVGGVAAAASGEACGAARSTQLIDLELGRQQETSNGLRAQCGNCYPREVRDNILRIAKDGHSASQTQLHLRRKFVDDAGAGLPEQLVPPVTYIQGVIDDDKRFARNGLGPYDSLAIRNREMATQVGGYRCISYQEADPDAEDRPGLPQTHREGVMWASVYTTLALLQHAVGAGVAGLDAKWRTCSDGHCVLAILAGRSRRTPKPGEGPIPELKSGGWETQDMMPVVVM